MNSNGTNNDKPWEAAARKTEEDEVIKKASELGLGYINLDGYPFETETLTIIPLDISKEQQIVSYFRDGKKIKVAILEPGDEINQMLDEISETTRYKFELNLASKSSITYAIKMYELVAPKKAEKAAKIEGAEVFEKEIKHLTDLKEKINTVPTTQIVDLILGGAMATSASDVHIEPRANNVEVRYRIDGVLHDIVKLSKEVYSPIISRIKFLSALKMNVSDMPQDGKFYLKDKNGKATDIRTSVIPTIWGENIVLRIFGTEATSLNLENLGFKDADSEILNRNIAKTNGMILVTGPTGSGKTTTLYAILNKLNKEEVKIITLEDPVEYFLEGISQSQVEPESGYSFAIGLKSILRQDPDILMVGEIRDFETAEIATHAALTGHLVLSTTHTNDAFGAIPRLVDIGIKPFLIINSLSLVIAQRLVRKICPACKKEYRIDKAMQKQIEDIISGMPKERRPKKIPEKLLKAKGCLKCNNTGYQGRIGIFELFEITKEFEDLILKKGTAFDFRDKAKKIGMLSMLEDGLLKVLDGVTTIEELWRVTNE